MKDKGSDGRPPQIHIDQAVIEHYGLNHNAGWLYVVIVSHVNGKTGVAFPGLARLAKLTGMSKPTVIKYIKVLEDKGLIEVSRENVEGTSEKDVNHYKVLPVIGGKTVLPPSKEVAKETDVVKPFDYVKKPVDHLVKEDDDGSKAVLPQVVKPVDSNHLESNHLELTKKKESSAKAPRPRKAQPYDDVDATTRRDIISGWLTCLPEKPATNEYEKITNQNLAANIARAGYLREDVEKYVTAQYQDKFWQGKYMSLEHIAKNLPIWLKKQSNTPPSVPPVSPNGAKPTALSPNNPANAWAKHKKASGE